MYKAKGFTFYELSNGEIHKNPFDGIPVSGYEEVHQIMKEMKITRYMFILREVKE